MFASAVRGGSEGTPHRPPAHARRGKKSSGHGETETYMKYNDDDINLSFLGVMMHEKWLALF